MLWQAEIQRRTVSMFFNVSQLCLWHAANKRLLVILLSLYRLRWQSARHKVWKSGNCCDDKTPFFYWVEYLEALKLTFNVWQNINISKEKFVLVFLGAVWNFFGGLFKICINSWHSHKCVRLYRFRYAPRATLHRAVMSKTENWRGTSCVSSCCAVVWLEDLLM